MRPSFKPPSLSTRLPMALLGTALLAGCVANMPGMRATTATGNLSARASKGVAGVEHLVDRERIAGALRVLAGTAPIAPSITIPERGSVNGRSLTRQFIRETLVGHGYTPEAHAYRDNGENIIAKLQAESPTDTWIVVGAHMDSVRNAGADDNGSGSSAVLEAAAVLKNLPGRKVNVMFAWFDEEELGLVGSVAMARDFRKQGLKLQSVHTVDMLGWDKDGDNKIEIERPDGNLFGYYQMVNDTHGLKLPLARTNSGSTDHVAFRDAGFASVGLCEEWAGGDTTPHYHRKTDTFDTINLDYLAAGTRLLVAAVGDLSRGVQGPAATKVPHSAFPGRERHYHGATGDSH